MKKTLVKTIAVIAILSTPVIAFGVFGLPQAGGVSLTGAASVNGWAVQGGVSFLFGSPVAPKPDRPEYEEL